MSTVDISTLAPRINEAASILTEMSGYEDAVLFLDSIAVLLLTDEEWAVAKDTSLPDDDPRVLAIDARMEALLEDAGVDTIILKD